MDTRMDDASEMTRLTNRFYKQRALIVLGGASASGWETLAQDIKPDVLLGANGVNGKIPFLDYWLCSENMTYPAKMAATGDPRYQDIMKMFQRVGAGTRLVNWKSWEFLKDKTRALRIDRDGRELDEMDGFSFRNYGKGLLNGARMQRPDVIKDLRAGTVGLQLLHLAGILGCREIHTIGFDLCLKGDEHHWYTYPSYESNRFYGEKMFVNIHGLDTLWFWVDTAEYLKQIEPQMESEGLVWTDHSNGLLTEFSLNCTKRMAG